MGRNGFNSSKSNIEMARIEKKMAILMLEWVETVSILHNLTLEWQESKKKWQF